MEYLFPFFIDSLNLILRGTHLVVGIAWIGASFYFVWLDNSLHPPKEAALKELGVSGELWAVHGGGFYNPQKYAIAPKVIPNNLHWFYWEAYSTWLSGIALFTVSYLANASVMLVDVRVADISGNVAIAAALAYLTVGWLIYNQLCKFFGVGPKADKKVAICIFIYIIIATWIACHIFSGRAAFLMTGAMMATIMAANVFFWIIPGQKKVIASIKAGEAADPVHGMIGKQRSVHNTFFTLPVLFCMISNHYSMTYQAKDNWLVLVMIMTSGALIRYFFVSRHKNKPHYPSLIISIVLLILCFWKIAPVHPVKTVVLTPPTIEKVEAIIQERCVVCHNNQIANKNIRLNERQLIEDQAALIHQQVVVSKIMPMGNATNITDEERNLIDLWFQAKSK